MFLKYIDVNKPRYKTNKYILYTNIFAELLYNINGVAYETFTEA